MFDLFFANEDNNNSTINCQAYHTIPVIIIIKREWN